MRYLIALLPPNSASLAALAAALMFANPAAAQEFERDTGTQEITQFERSPPRGEPSGGPARYEMPRAETPPQAPRAQRPAPRFERPAPPSPSQTAPDRPAPRG